MGRQALPRKPALLLKVRPSFLERKRTKLLELYFEFLFLWPPTIDRAPSAQTVPTWVQGRDGGSKTGWTVGTGRGRSGRNDPRLGLLPFEDGRCRGGRGFGTRLVGRAPGLKIILCFQVVLVITSQRQFMVGTEPWAWRLWNTRVSYKASPPARRAAVEAVGGTVAC